MRHLRRRRRLPRARPDRTRGGDRDHRIAAGLQSQTRRAGAFARLLDAEDFTATFYEFDTSGPQVYAPVIWIVDPAILEVKSALEYGGPGPPPTPPSYTLTFTGKANGITNVVVYGGGPSSRATVAVEVTGC